MLRVKVVYGSVFGRLAGKSSDILELERASIAALVQELTRRHPKSFAEALVEPTGAPHPWVAVLVNGTVATPMTALREGDEVALLLSFEGG